MFVCTVRSKKLKWILLAVLVLLAAGAFWYASHSSKPAANDGVITLKAGTAEERLAFISQFGWDVDEDPVAVEEVRIPAQFDEVYERYNAVQKAQNMDLSVYAGERVKKWTYSVRNYPGYEQQEGVVELNLLIYDGCVIGGDVCSTEQGGFLHGFDRPLAEPETTQ